MSIIRLEGGFIRTCLIMLLGFHATDSIAQQLPRQILMQEFGVSFDMPSGWQGQSIGSSIRLNHNLLPGFMLLTENPARKTAELKALAMKGLSDIGVQLTPVDDFVSVGSNRVDGYYQGRFNGSQVKVYAIGLINGLGSGINVFVLAETPDFTLQHPVAANKLAASIRFLESVEAASTVD